MPDISGVGVDLIEIDRIRSSVEKYGDAFLEKLFTVEEREGFKKHQDPAVHIAGRFAAKEAIAKALGTGFGKELSWHDIVITSDASGRPLADVKGKAVEIQLSISHSRSHATAFAVALSSS